MYAKYHPVFALYSAFRLKLSQPLHMTHVFHGILGFFDLTKRSLGEQFTFEEGILSRTPRARLLPRDRQPFPDGA